MNHDALLTYLSEVQMGTWEQFKNAFSALQNDENETHAATQARLLSALAHVEFAWTSQPQWSICSPVLAQLPRREPPIAVLCGQRPLTILTELQTQAKKIGATVLELPQLDGPHVIQITASTTDILKELADKIGIVFAPRSVEQIAVCVPTLSSLLDSSQATPYPAIPPIEYFDADRLIWQAVDRVDRDGLYRYENFYPDYRLISKNSCRRVTREIGIYAAVNRPLWVYDHETHKLAIPRRFLPPPLYQRALVLCSGFLATYGLETNRWLYRDVPPAVALFLGKKLNQSLEATC